MIDTPICPLCGGRDNAVRFSIRGHRLMACNGCELLFMDPYPSSSDDVHHHVSEYEYEDLEITDPESHYRSSIEFYKRYFALIAQECKGAKAVLDVGCGSGHLLELLGSDPDLYRVGIELNTGRAEVARKKTGCPIHEVPIEEFSSETKFDAIFMINVTSHIPAFAFADLFGALRSLLVPEGKLILKVGEHTKNVQRWDVYEWGIPDHLHFFGLNTLDFISRKYGFKISNHRRIPYSEDLFSPEWWRAPGRSARRNMIKQVVVHLPLGLRILAKYYDMRHGGRVYSSLVTLTPEPR